MEINGVKFELNPDQMEALWSLRDFLVQPRSQQPVFGLFGHAGTGKTTVLVRLADTLEFQFHKILLTAPTHKATHVLANMARDFGVPYDTRTLASALCMKPEMIRGKQVFIQAGDWKDTSPLRFYTTIVVDECSMVDTKTYTTLMDTADHFDVKVVFTGDPYQLPPVGEESTNRGKSMSFNAPRAHTLTKVERCDGALFAVVDKARELIGTGITPQWADTNEVRRFQRVGQFGQWFLDHVDQGAKYITYTNKSVLKWNDTIHKQLHGVNAAPFLPGHEVYAARGSEHWAAHQPFEIIEAHHDVVEGLDAWMLVLGPGAWGFTDDATVELGYRTNVTVVDPSQRDELDARIEELKAPALKFQAQAAEATSVDERRSLKARERDAWKAMFAFSNKFADFRRPHAMTVHASQGSTYPYTFVNERNILQKCRHSLTKAKLLYVAYSRAAEKLGVI